MVIIFEVVFPWLATGILLAFACLASVRSFHTHAAVSIACAIVDWALFGLTLRSAIRIRRLRRKD